MNTSCASIPFLVEIGGDRLVGGVDVVVGAAVLEPHRLADRRLADFTVGESSVLPSGIASIGISAR